METWNDKVLKFREAQSWTQHELARQVGVSVPTVCDWENHKIKNLRGPNLLKLCEIMKLKPEELLADSATKTKGGRAQCRQQDSRRELAHKK